MRIPTYANHMNMISNIRNVRNDVDKYSYQTVSGLKYRNYSGYGMSANNIVSMESMLKITNTFMDNNKLADVSLKTMNLSLQSIIDSLQDMKNLLNDCYGSDLAKISPDKTGGKLSFLSDNPDDYIGKTLTVNGTTYTFATDGTGDNIDISGATSAEEIMQAVQNKVARSDFVYENGELSFPLYTIDGPSSVIDDASLVKTGEPHTPSPEQMLALQNMQNLAFSIMQFMADTLNTNVGGKYVFGGGSSTAPVSFEFSSLQDFQRFYDGINTIYPSTSSAVLSHYAVNASKTGDIAFAKDANGTYIEAKGGSFLESAIVMNDSNVGEVSFDSLTNTMKGSQYGAFSSLHEGDTIIIGGDGAGGNARSFVVKSVSADGRTVTFDESAVVEDVAPFTPSGEISISKSFPIGSVINLNGFGDNNIAPTATVTGISDDGTKLYIKVDESRFPLGDVTSSTRWSLETQSYYQGGTLEYNQRISESQTISFDIKGSDPAFEKIFRALGQLAQGNIVDLSDPTQGESFDPMKTRNLIDEAMALITDATSSTADISKAKNASLYSVSARINANYTILNKVIENQEMTITNLENNIGSLKNADKDEAGVLLLLAESTLDASYAILSSVSRLSLLDYIK